MVVTVLLLGSRPAYRALSLLPPGVSRFALVPRLGFRRLCTASLPVSALCLLFVKGTLLLSSSLGLFSKLCLSGQLGSELGAVPFPPNVSAHQPHDQGLLE